MNNHHRTVAVLGVILLVMLSVISFLVYDVMTEKNPYYVSQEFEVSGSVGGEAVYGTCVSEWNNHSGAGDIILYSVDLKESIADDFRFYIYFDDSGRPSKTIYDYISSEDRWIINEDSETYSFQCIGSKRIDNVKILAEDTTFFFKEVVN